MRKAVKNWYADWFDTDFYHILYQDRDHEEAELFMNNLSYYLKLSKNKTILDMACGKGRHAIYLNQLGYDVTGIDLSENSINHAKQFENPNLRFRVHNMCRPYPQKFDAVFNLFTSLGYFDDEQDNFNTIKAIKANLHEEGRGVIDFMNVDYVVDHLVSEDIKTVDGIHFHQKRYIKTGYIYKEISFHHQNETFHFTEKVKAIRLSDFEAYFHAIGIELVAIFGDYNLGPFHAKTSERLILIFK